MKRHLRISAMVWAMVWAMLTTASVHSSDAVSFNRDVVPLLKARCAACHLTGDEPGKMQLHPQAAYRTLVNSPSIGSSMLRVEPGSPDTSYLIRKLEGTHLAAGGSGARMPLDAAALDPTDIARIREWISAGALDN